MSLTKFCQCILRKKHLMRVFPRYSNTFSGNSGKGNNISYTGNNDENTSATSTYDCRKYGHNLPCDSVAPYFETLAHIPTGIFRCTYGEMLGRGAKKGGFYQNPEYFSYQHMTFYDMHMILRSFRQPSPKTKRKPN